MPSVNLIQSLWNSRQSDSGSADGELADVTAALGDQLDLILPFSGSQGKVVWSGFQGKHKNQALEQSAW